MPRAKTPAPPALQTKTRPSQDRAQETFELILRTAGRLLETMGFEQLSTNLVCREAGLTPPALYRYFPNKYAILVELGDRLMKAQDAILVQAIETRLATDSVERTTEEKVAASVAIQTAVIEATRAFPGGVAITRALRAVPMLKDVRLKSREEMVEAQTRIYARAYPAIPHDTLVLHTRLCLEMQYAAMEMALDEPGPHIPELLEGAARSMVLYLEDLERRRLPPQQ